MVKIGLPVWARGARRAFMREKLNGCVGLKEDIVTMRKENQNQTKKLVVAAMMAALTCVATLLAFPVVGGSGYVNFGDCMVILSGALLGGPFGIAAAAIGAMLADVILGYYAYAPATLVIKALMALEVWKLYGALEKRAPKQYILWIILTGILAECIMSLGYFLYEIPLYGLATALIDIPANLLQSAFGLISSAVLGSILVKINIKRFWSAE